MDINYRILRNFCLAPIEAFLPLGTATETKRGRHVYIDRGASVLGVAHLDSVQKTDHFYHLEVDKGNYVLNAQLDDRLGVYVIMQLLWEHANYDVLLTEGEETGNSTAGDFKTGKKYKWMFSFDRHGDDVVTYQYGSNLLNKHLRKAGWFQINHGSFSDIARLDRLGCEGFNVGVGYKDEHSKWAIADMGMMLSQASKFLEFYKKFHNTAYPYDPKAKPVTTGVSGFSSWVGRNYGRDFYDAERGGAPNYRQFPLATTSGYDGEDCKFCGRPLVQQDAAAKHLDCCLICDPHVTTCMLCNQFTIIEQMVDGMCKSCYNKLAEGYQIMTYIRCPSCHTRYMTTEIREGRCRVCQHEVKADELPPDLKLPDWGDADEAILN